MVNEWGSKRKGTSSPTAYESASVRRPLMGRWILLQASSLQGGYRCSIGKYPSTGMAQQRPFLVLKVALHAVVVISKVLH